MNVILLGNGVFVEVITLRWGHTRLEWVLTPITGVLIKKDRFWDTERLSCMPETETGVMYLQAKDCWHLPEASGEPCLPQNIGVNKLCWHLDFRNSKSPLGWKNKFLDWKNECELWRQRVIAHHFISYDFWEGNVLIHSTGIYWPPSPCWILELQVRHGDFPQEVSLFFSKAQFPPLLIWG